MFKYTTEKLILKNKKAIHDSSAQNVDSSIVDLLSSYEKGIYESLIRKRNNLGFKFVMSQLKRGMFETMVDEQVNSDLATANLITVHPNFIGDKIINVFSEYINDDRNNYIVTYEGELNKIMMDSRVKAETIIKQYQELVEYFSINGTLELIFIKIYDSELLKFEQINFGARTKKYQIK